MLTETRQQLLYRSKYRGTKETDLLVGNYALEAIAMMDVAQLEVFAQFLNENDQDIYRWITDRAAIVPELYVSSLIPAIRKFHGLAV